MSWRVAHRETDQKYRLWSTISDRWLTSWGTKQEIQRYIAENYLREYKKQVIEMYLQFPDDWLSKENEETYMSDDAAHEAYVAWLEMLRNAKSPDELVENTYNEVLKALAL